MELQEWLDWYDKFSPEVVSRMEGQAAAVIRNLMGENERLREAVKTIASYDEDSGASGICPYGCDTPYIAQAALRQGERDEK